MAKGVKLQINYKSGQSMIVTCDSLKLQKSYTGAITSAEWKNMKPEPLTMGIDHVESIWQLN